MNKYSTTRLLTLTALAMSMTMSLASAERLTAFQAFQLANKKMNEHASHKPIKIYGSPNSPEVLPLEWRIWFYDPHAEQHGTMVRVAGDAIVEIKDGYTEMNSFRLASYKLEEVIDPKLIKIDSSDILNILKKDSKLKNTTITSVSLELKKVGKGPLAPVHWFIELYNKEKDGNKEQKIGEAEINSFDGKTLKLKIYDKKL